MRPKTMFLLFCYGVADFLLASQFYQEHEPPWQGVNLLLLGPVAVLFVYGVIRAFLEGFFG